MTATLSFQTKADGQRSKFPALVCNIRGRFPLQSQGKFHSVVFLCMENMFSLRFFLRSNTWALKMSKWHSAKWRCADGVMKGLKGCSLGKLFFESDTLKFDVGRNKTEPSEVMVRHGTVLLRVLTARGQASAYTTVYFLRCLTVSHLRFSPVLVKNRSARCLLTWTFKTYTLGTGWCPINEFMLQNL